MKFTYKKYRNIQWHAHDHHFGEISLFAAKLIIFMFELSVILGTILGTGYAVGKLLE